MTIITIRTENTNPNSAERLRREARGFISINIPHKSNRFIRNPLSDMNDRYFEVQGFLSGRF